MSTQVSPPPRDGSSAVRNDLRNLDKVRGIFLSMAKFASAQGIYQSNNPNLIKFARSFDEAFRSYFANENELLLTVEQYRLIWREQVVYDIGCNTESIAFLLYKDGIGEISIQSAVKKDELEQFVGILKNALYNPSAQFDTATALWQAEFPNIFYRVLDEQTDGTGGDGDGSGNSRKEQPLQADDHLDIVAARASPGAARDSDSSLETLGTYLDAVVTSNCVPGAGASERERMLQRILTRQFSLDSEALARWRSASQAGEDSDDLTAFLRIILDFTSVHSAPPVVRDVSDTIERLTHYIRDEGHVSTLIATLTMLAGIDTDRMDGSFASVPEHIEEELTDSVYLLSLVKSTREGCRPEDILRYLNLVGANAVAAVCELLASSTEPAIHEKGCEVLINIAGADILRIIEGLHVENAWLASDVVYLLSRSSLTTIVPAVHRIVSSPDPNIRGCAIEYLVRLGTDEAAQLLRTLLGDPHPAVRIKALSAVGRFRHPSIIEEVTALCFAEQTVSKSSDEVEHLFRALGKLAGASALPRLRQTIDKKHYFAGRNRGRRDRLVAITALRHIPGSEAESMLERLSRDGDNLVRTKALHMLKQRAARNQTDEWTITDAGTTRSES